MTAENADRACRPSPTARVDSSSGGCACDVDSAMARARSRRRRVSCSSQDDLAENLAPRGALIDEAARARREARRCLPENFALHGRRGEQARRRRGPRRRRRARSRRALVERARAPRVWLVAGGMPERSRDRGPAVQHLRRVRARRAGRRRATARFTSSTSTWPTARRYRESGVDDAPASEPSVADVGAASSSGCRSATTCASPSSTARWSSAAPSVLVGAGGVHADDGQGPLARAAPRARDRERRPTCRGRRSGASHPRGRQTYGKSCVIDPWGEVIAQASEGEGVDRAPLDPAYLAQVRANLPSLTHRRMYARVTGRA